MKTPIFLLILLAVSVMGCESSVCERENTGGCDRSCINDEDCKSICGAGCININEEFDPLKAEIDCTPSLGCYCDKNICKSK
ncbi:hypothetical protein ACFLZX_04900 [Nanoarchaeota archaeon]